MQYKELEKKLTKRLVKIMIKKTVYINRLFFGAFSRNRRAASEKISTGYFLPTFQLAPDQLETW